jgi:hypothetical protein
MPLDEPLVRGICEAWESINQLGKIIDTLKAERPQLYRPLVSPVRNSGLSATESAWAERQRRAAAEVEAGKRPEPPRE